MDGELRERLAELYAEGVAHDEGEPDRLRRYRNLEPDSAELLAMTVRIAGARSVAEIGTSNGHSTMWLADAARDTGGQVVSVDVERDEAAARNLAEAGLGEFVELRREDGGQFLASLPDSGLDLLFMDAERTEYVSWWPHPARVLRPGGTLAIDNVLSHPDEVREFLALVADGPFVGRTVQVGKGLHLAWLRA